MPDRLQEIANNAETLADLHLLSTGVRDNLRSAAFLLRELARYDGTQFDTPRLMHAINNVRNSQA
jgi:hypothetical protein